MIQSEVAFLLRLLDNISPDGRKPPDDEEGSLMFWLIWMRITYLDFEVNYSPQYKQWYVVVRKP